MDKLKKMTTYRLFWPIVCLALVLLFNLIKSPSFFEISIKNGVLYGYLVDIFNRSSELIILAVGMTLCVASSAGTDISVGAIMALSGAVSVYLLGSGETFFLVSSLMYPRLFNTLDTVVGETPATFATSFIPGFIPYLPFLTYS